MMRKLYRLSYKYGRYSIQNLMLIIVCAQAFVYVASMMNGSFVSLLTLDMDMVLSGQVWRLITFVFIPPASSPIFILIALYFYYMIGSALENQWGSFLFNVYYLIGILGAIVAAVITGYGTNVYINLSLFFAFAILFPDFELLLFFVLPLKIKYLALFNAIVYGYSFITGTWYIRASIVFSLVNLVLFFWPNIKIMLRRLTKK